MQKSPNPDSGKKWAGSKEQPLAGFSKTIYILQFISLCLVLVIAFILFRDSIAAAFFKAFSMVRVTVIIGVMTVVEILLLRSWGDDLKSLQTHNPPHLAQILLLILPRRNREHIIGDLEEEYRTSHKRFPRLWYWTQAMILTLSYLRVFLRRLVGFDVIRKMIRK